MNMQQQNMIADNYHTLLYEYAAGLLDTAQNLAVSAHLSLSATGRDNVALWESIGGEILECETPAACKENSLQSVLDRLDEKPSQKEQQPLPAECCDIFGENHAIPTPISHLFADPKQSRRWKNIFPGIQGLDLNLACDTSTARFLKARPGLKSPHHAHGGMEITLVVSGAFHDETGDYKIGDLIVTDDSVTHTPVACNTYGCTCLVVSTAPIKLKGLASLLNPFLRR